MLRKQCSIILTIKYLVYTRHSSQTHLLVNYFKDMWQIPSCPFGRDNSPKKINFFVYKSSLNSKEQALNSIKYFQICDLSLCIHIQQETEEWLQLLWIQV